MPSFNYLSQKTTIKINDIFHAISLYKTPFWIYDSNVIRQQVNKLKNFDVIRYAQKACSNIHILRLLKKCRVKIDAVSHGEIERALIAGFSSANEEIVYTADTFDDHSLHKVILNNITVNVGSIDMLYQLGRLSPKHKIWIRVNPHFGHGHSKKTNTGGEYSKHGIWNIPSAIKVIKKFKFKLLGIHIHIGSGVDYIHLKKVCNFMETCVKNLDYDISAISAGGGLPIPYLQNDIPINIKNYYHLWKKVKNNLTKFLNHTITLEIEPGRFLVAESGFLIAKVYAIKKVNNITFVITNVGFNDLMRPVLYGSYHKISIIPINKRTINYNVLIKTIVAGPLCESGDVFDQSSDGTLQPRLLPKIKIGDIIVFHDVGAYGASMSSTYNSRPMIPEILFERKKLKMIRRRQTISEIIELECLNKN